MSFLRHSTTSNANKRMITTSSQVDVANISITQSQLLSPIKDVSYRWEWWQQRCPSLLCCSHHKTSHFSKPPFFHHLHHLHNDYITPKITSSFFLPPPFHITTTFVTSYHLFCLPPLLQTLRADLKIMNTETTQILL